MQNIGFIVDVLCSLVLLSIMENLESSGKIYWVFMQKVLSSEERFSPGTAGVVPCTQEIGFDRNMINRKSDLNKTCSKKDEDFEKNTEPSNPQAVHFVSFVLSTS